MIIKHAFNPLLLQWKWTTSRARNSDGWNICTLYADGQKVGKTTGGNYDMRGTAYGQFIEAQYQDRLLKLHRRAGRRVSVSPSGEYKRLKAKKLHHWISSSKSLQLPRAGGRRRMFPRQQEQECMSLSDVSRQFTAT